MLRIHIDNIWVGIITCPFLAFCNRVMTLDLCKHFFLIIDISFKLMMLIDVAVLTAGSHNYDENINRSIIQLTIKFIKDSQRFE